MNVFAILAVALALAADAVAVAIALGISGPLSRGDIARASLLFGGFQAAMPVIGFLLASWIGPAIAAYDHWVAFVLLGGLGLSMLREAFKREESAKKAPRRDLRFLVGLAIATSVDAAIVGVTLPTLNVPFGPTIATIGLVTAALSALGAIFGARLGERAGSRIDALGGLILIALGIKILVEHLSA